MAMLGLFQANQTILGVMGSDVTVKEMTEFIPDRLVSVLELVLIS